MTEVVVVVVMVEAVEDEFTEGNVIYQNPVLKQDLPGLLAPQLLHKRSYQPRNRLVGSYLFFTTL